MRASDRPEMTRNPVSRLRRFAKATTALVGTMAVSACLGTGDGAYTGGGGGGGGGIGGGSGFRSGGGGQTIATYETDPEYQGMGGLTQVGASTYFNGGSNPNGYTGSGVTVAVMDSGIDIDHSEFAGGLHPASQSLVGGSVDDIGGHGTAVAGVVGAARDGNVMHGIAFNSTILALRTDLPGTCPAACLYGQTELAAATNIATVEGADVINYSLGGYGGISALWRTAMINAANNGAVIVASAGNDFDTDPILAANPINPAALVATEPALMGPMIAAGAYDTFAGDIANFSNRAGVAQDYYLLAPGVGLLTTDIGGGYTVVSGTSFSAPLIAGAAALLKERFPALTPTQIVDILLVSATDLGAPGTDPIYGRGLMNLAAAALPLGTLSIPTTASVDGGGADPDQTMLQLGAAFGDALSRSSVLASTMFLDGYGRDYYVDLTGSIATQSTGPDVLGFLTAGNSGERFETALTPGTRIQVRADEAGDEPARWEGAALVEDGSEASFNLRHQISEDTDITVAQGQGAGSRFGLHGAGAPVGGGLLGASDMAFIGMADTGGNATVSTRLGDGLQLRVGVGMNEAALGQELENGPDDASVYVAEMSHLAESGLRLGIQFGRLIEEDGLLQAGGDGGFSLGGTATTDFVTAFGVVPLTDSVDLFGSYTSGQSDAGSLSTDLIGGFSGVRSEAMSLGLAARDLFAGDDRLSIAVMQPLRVTDGSATVTTPQSRTLEGAVAFQEETVGLEPSGRETDAEVTYGFSLSPDEQLDFSFVTRFEPDHVRDADPEFSAGLRYRLSF